MQLKFFWETGVEIPSTAVWHKPSIHQFEQSDLSNTEVPLCHVTESGSGPQHIHCPLARPGFYGNKGWWGGLGQVGGSGKLSPSQSHEPASNVATAVAAG